MGFCVVTATVNRAAAPWVGGGVWFTLRQGSYAIDAHYPSTTIQADIRPDGKAIAALWNNEEGFIPTQWQCQMPDGESFEFSIPVGLTDATLEYLRSLTSQPPPAPGLGAIIQAAIVQHNADPLAHLGLGGGGGSSGLIPVSIGADTIATPGGLYIASTPTILNISLPAIAAEGATFGFINKGPGTIRVVQSADQQIVAGDAATTIGVTGRISSFALGDWAEFLYSGGLWWTSIKSGYLEVV